MNRGKEQEPGGHRSGLEVHRPPTFCLLNILELPGAGGLKAKLAGLEAWQPSGKAERSVQRSAAPPRGAETR